MNEISTRLAVALCCLLILSGFAFAQTTATSYSWTSTGPIISAKSDSTHNIIAVKDPSAVLYNGRWVIYASDVNSSGNYNMEYLNVAEDWSDPPPQPPTSWITPPASAVITPRRKSFISPLRTSGI
jgi:endo-1,4-beta-xylanase